MVVHWSANPVFARELLAGSRRWQGFAGRSLFVGILLAWLLVVWRQVGPVVEINPYRLSVIGSAFATGVLAIQLALVLLVGPAATASSLCVEKGRGTLHHAFLTDLSPGEIVRGKLAAKLLPLLGLLTCSFPVLALTALFGGVSYAWLLGAYLVVVGSALVGSSLGLCLSVWARKPHQALLGAYAILGTALLVWPVAQGVAARWTNGLGPVLERLLADLNPVVLVILPSWATPVGLGLADQAAFLAVCVLVSWMVLGLTTSRVRPVSLSQVNRPARRPRPGLPAKTVGFIPGPDLDANPILWREWHRKRPTLWVGRAWTAFGILALLASANVLALYYLYPGEDSSALAGHVNAGVVGLGLLLLGISSASSLAEERDRGSLDVIMTTTLTTREIVTGKWWGSFAMVGRLAILPTWVAAGMAMVSGGWLGTGLLILQMLTVAAMVTSLGLAMATWARRPGRSIFLTVTLYGLLTLGWPVLIAASAPFLLSSPPFWEGIVFASPIVGADLLTRSIGSVAMPSQSGKWEEHWSILSWNACWVLCYACSAAFLRTATHLTFDRRLGRTTSRKPSTAGDSRRRSGPL